MKESTRGLLHIALILSIMPSVWITSAYAAQINAVGLITPQGGFVPGAGKGIKAGTIIESREFSSISNFTVTKKEMAVINSQTFLQRWLDTVGKNKQNLLWSSYPASIRGQIFGHQPAGSNPITSGGW